MGYSLLKDGATPPPWPHVVCVSIDQGGGYAWHEDMSRRGCFTGGDRGYLSGTVSLPADLVASAIDGRELTGIDRLLAISRVKKEGGSTVWRRLFRQDCFVRGCGKNHLERARVAVRMIEHYIHPQAIEALRKARVPEYLLLSPWFCDRPARSSDHLDEEQKRQRAARDAKRMLYLPVCRTLDRTLSAQLAFAGQYLLQQNHGRGDVHE